MLGRISDVWSRRQSLSVELGIEQRERESIRTERRKADSETESISSLILHPLGSIEARSRVPFGQMNVMEATMSIDKFTPTIMRSIQIFECRYRFDVIDLFTYILPECIIVLFDFFAK